MDSLTDGAFDAYWGNASASQEQLASINRALNATLDPRISNELRQQALEYLEHVKNEGDGPNFGFILAEDWDQDNAVRYFGLKLLEYAVRYKWADYTPQQTDQLRHWVKCLAGSVRGKDELYICNKIGQLWVEVSKRCWGEEWADMDTLLVSMWDKPINHKGMATKIMVLSILELLSEDVINNEDAVAGLRLDVLGNALNEIIVPAGLYAQFETGTGKRSQLRSGEEGWLARVCGFFSMCIKEVRLTRDPDLAQTMSFCAVKALHTLRSIVVWINLKATVEVNAVDALFLPFYSEDIQLQIAATEVLYSLLSRPYGPHWHGSWHTLFQQVLQPDRIALIRQSFERIQISAGEDDGKYTLQKKLSELLSILADAIAQHPDELFPKTDAPAFFDLLLSFLQSKSLVVSIPILHSWTKLMICRHAELSQHIFQSLAAVLQTCSTRLLRYEALADSDETEDEIVQFLNEDFDTIPERHAFLGNYRRYCVTVIQITARSRPSEALSHVLGQMRQLLEVGPYSPAHGFEAAQYSKTGLPTLQFDAQFQVVANALKGYSSWLADGASLSPGSDEHSKAEKDKEEIVVSLQDWSSSVIALRVDDPEAAGQTLQTLVTILRLIHPGSGFVLQIVQHLLTVRLLDSPAHVTFTEFAKGFDSLRISELQRVAYSFPNELLGVYHDLDERIGALEQEYSNDSRLFWGYRAFLFLIIHRATNIDHEARLMRLQNMLKPVYDAWTDESLNNSLATFHSFCESLGLGGLPEFYKAYRFAEVSDWASQQLDQTGQAKQAEIRAKGDQLPLRMTKSMLASSTEKLKSDSNEFEVACQLWSGMIPTILPKLLRMLSHAQAFHNLANWSQLPEELQMVVKRTLQDRFWQSGISNESKDEFYARITGSKTSYEGFASVVRGTTRLIRDQVYQILYLMTKFEEQFYGLPDLAPGLAEALFTDANSLTPSHLHSIVNLTTGLVQRCPPHHRAHFLPPLLIQIFTKFDSKISTEWEAIAHASHQNAEEEELSEEMRMESVLRHLTYSMVSFVTFLLDFDSPSSGHEEVNGHAPMKPTLKDLVLSEPRVLEPLILFCTHALRMRDTRCCTAICRVFRNVIPLFQSDTATAEQVRAFISTEVLKACITSLHETYFADMQKDLAALIAQIISIYADRSHLLREVLLSLPSMSTGKVEKAIQKIQHKGSERHQRAVVLELLEGLRGVSIHEVGKIVQKKTVKQGVASQYMEVEQKRVVANGDDSGLEGVSGLFGET